MGNARIFHPALRLFNRSSSFRRLLDRSIPLNSAPSSSPASRLEGKAREDFFITCILGSDLSTLIDTKGGDPLGQRKRKKDPRPSGKKKHTAGPPTEREQTTTSPALRKFIASLATVRLR